MTRVTQRPTDPQFPLFHDWHRRACAARDRIIDEWNAAGRPAKWKARINEELYREFRQVFLYKAFHLKCAYCESKIGAESAVQVEHYRPKGSLADDSGAASHPGYFWLAYEWWNLVPTCNNCNTWHSDPMSGERNSGKSTKFPIEGLRVSNPSQDPDSWQEELDVEKGLLLNPYQDDPAEHIDFDPLSGLPIPLTHRGDATIKLCDLRRETLCDSRRIRGNEAMFRIIHQLVEQVQLDGTRSEGKAPAVASSEEHSLWRRRLLLHWLDSMRTRAQLETSNCDG